MPCDFSHRPYTQLTLSNFYFFYLFPNCFFKSYSLKSIFYFCFVAFVEEHIDDNKTLQNIFIRILFYYVTKNY